MAAGAGFKTWATGDVLTAVDVNEYLMQGVWVFDDASDRSTQVTSPQEGNTSYLKDTDSLEIYDGSSWVAQGGGGGGGKVLQVVQGTSTTRVDVASTVFTDSGLSATITPSAATSKILVLVSEQVYHYRATNVSAARVRLMRDSTVIWGNSATGPTHQSLAVGATQNELGVYLAISYLDSPSTTSAITYKTQGRAEDTANSGDMSFHKASNSNTIILIEIGA